MKFSSISRLFLLILLVLDYKVSLAYIGGGEEQQDYSSSTLPTWLQDTTSLLHSLLSYDYYNGHESCPMLEEIINSKVKKWFEKDQTLAPSLLRLHFHDCAVTGCDGSILLNHEGSERRAEASKTLRGFEVIDDIKAEVEKVCPAKVSCTDILTATARDATVLLGGEYWRVPYGRKDSRISNAKDATKVPMGRETITTLLEFFQARGLNVIDLVVLSGAHTIGRTTCSAIGYRLNQTGYVYDKNPPIDGHYLDFLQRKCRYVSENVQVFVGLDAETPTSFDSKYYENLQNKMGLLSTDQLLYSDSRTRFMVDILSKNPWLFKNQFAASMVKYANIGVLTDQDREGEIRTNCNFVNSY